MPSRKAIARHHGLALDVCWRCDYRTDRLERAHIVDRMEWEAGAGLDGPQNLALLCGACHRQMPIIEPDHWEEGLRYVGLDRVRRAFDAGTLPVGPVPFTVRAQREAHEDMDRGVTAIQRIQRLIESATPEELAGVRAAFGLTEACAI